ncbi:MAG: hypothetical protein DBY09_04345 [Selenomonadales bacterium]|nr:MAG: hypothetical protein DBY09_04345 [Selenomonadales bacterium]
MEWDVSERRRNMEFYKIILQAAFADFSAWAFIGRRGRLARPGRRPGPRGGRLVRIPPNGGMRTRAAPGSL